jgi:catechol 2,3-dioxygenase-like lactoylglutathione lyase family enzyme
MSIHISGIQQMGIGIPNVHEAWAWYRRHFFIDVPVFEEAATAALMLPYTGGEPRDRHAILALSKQGGGGFEIWQYTSRVPQPPSFEVKLGDLGLNICKLKSRDIHLAHAHLTKLSAPGLTPIYEEDGRAHFYCKDLYGNPFQIVQAKDFFAKDKAPIAGVYGAIIGVSDIAKSLTLYKDILGYDEVVYEKNGKYADFEEFQGEDVEFERVLLRHSKARVGGFSEMLGPTELELIARKDGRGMPIFKDRFWGDLGYIHLCFDVTNMEALQKELEAGGFKFTVDSASSFDMGEAAGRFTYIEDPDGTWIEFVETHKVPIMKKLGWYLNLKNRKPHKPLPRFMLRAMSLNRKKD